jgi:hypothetical protein
MTCNQNILVALFLFYSLTATGFGMYHTFIKKNAYGITLLTRFFNLTGGFVWADLIVFGPFWFLTTLIILILQDWVLFLLLISVFWAVRSLGETIYWFNQQFSKVNRNPPGKFWLYKHIPNDSIWFIFQIFWQCITVVSIIFTIYFAKIWML